MTTQTSTTPIAFSGTIPKFYDSFLGTIFFVPYANDMASRIKNLAPGSILELACGTGRLTKLLPGVLTENATIVASDINPSMLAFVQEQIKNERIKWQIVDAVSLPFEDNSFDCIVVQFGVMFYSDKQKAFKEAFRVLKPGGTLIFNSWDQLKNITIALQAYETLLHFFPVDTPAFYSVPFSYYDEKIISEDLQKAGFKDVKIELVKLKGHSNSASDAAKGLIKGTPTVTAIEERDPEKLPVILEYLEKKITNLFGENDFDIPLQAFIASAKKGD
jgi:ubiquinone/menaquinone biosynthesis C-methylase UbiE